MSDPKQPEPWHPADEKKPQGGKRPSGGPLGTHSLTGGNANVGLPSSPHADSGVERSEPREERLKPDAEPDLMKEPRAGVGEILGRKP